MSVEIDWQALTTGPDGAALAESVRDFIHDKFQQVHLPKFIRSVKVHSFEFGDECPSVVLKDVSDPLDEFYEDEDEDDDNSEEGGDGNCGRRGVGGEGNLSSHPGGAESHKIDDGDNDKIDTGNLHASIETITAGPRPPLSSTQSETALPLRRGMGPELQQQLNPLTLSAHERAIAATSTENLHRPAGLRTIPSFVDQLASPLLSGRAGAGTPGIPGGTANLGYFHHAPFSHPQHAFPAPWSDYNFTRPEESQQRTAAAATTTQHVPPGFPLPPQPLMPLHQHGQVGLGGDPAAYSAGDPSTRPSTATTQTPLSRVPTGNQEQQSTPAAQRTAKSRRTSRARDLEQFAAASPGFSRPPSTTRPEPNPQDLQLVLHVRYSGGVRLALSAEILLDYPMSSFVSIPLQLTITGISFDGVAILAHVRPPLASGPPRSQQMQQEGMMGGPTTAGNSGSLGGDDRRQWQREEQDAAQSGNKGRAHICFLSPEDARALLGAGTHDGAADDDEDDNAHSGFPPSSPLGSPDSPTAMAEQRLSHEFSPISSRAEKRGVSSPSEYKTASPSSPMHQQKQQQQQQQQQQQRTNKGRQDNAVGDGGNGNGDEDEEGLGGLLKEIRVESEIGQRKEGQHSLRNVGKVEKFVLEQVRRIFEDEFVWPSFWTFLL